MTSITDHYTLTVPRSAIGSQEERKTTRYRNCNLLKNRESKEELDFLTLTELQKSKKLFETKGIHSCFVHLNLKIQEIVKKFIPEKIKVPGQNKIWVDNKIKNLSNKKHLLYKKYKIESLLVIWERYCAVKRRLRKIVVKKKQLHFQTLIAAESKSNNKSFFKTFHLLTGKESRSKPNLTIEQCHEINQFFYFCRRESGQKR